MKYFIYILSIFVLNNIANAKWEFALSTQSVAIKDGILYASTSEGIVYSTDNGNSWEQSGLWFDKEFLKIEKISTNNEFIYAIGHYLYISNNNGVSWITKPLPNIYVNDIAFKEDLLFLATDKGLFLSSDIGNTWENIEPQTDRKYKLLAINGDAIYLTVDSQKDEPNLYISFDNGKTWFEKTNGLKSLNNTFNNINRIFSYNDSIFLSNSTALFVTTNQQNEWAKIADINTAYFTINDNGLYYAEGSKLNFSNNFGKTFNSIEVIEIHNFNSIIFNEETNTVFVLGYYGKGLLSGLCKLYKINLNEFVSVNEHKDLKQPFIIYPNPATELININAELNIIRIELTDYLGKIISEQAPLNGMIHLPSLSEGVYLIKLYSINGEIYSEKVWIRK